MIRASGWDIAVLVAAVVLCALVVANGAEGPELAGGLAANAALVVVWFTLGRRGEHSRAAPVAVALLIVVSGVAAAVTPSMATMQAIVFPLLWALARTTRGAIITNLLLAVSVGTGYTVGLGVTADVIYEALVIELISFVGSLAIGLWITRISVESEERKRLLAELRDTQALLAAASRDAGVYGERERLARELHDTIAQDLTGLVLLVQRTRREVQSGHPTVGETLDLLEDSARATLAETRALVAVSAPVALEEGGLVAALERLGERIGRESGVLVTVSAHVADGAAPGSVPLERDDEVALLRLAQESLSNVRRHAGATRATVSLALDASGARLSVEDDGRGFDTSAPRTGFGLDGLSDRFALAGGGIEIDSAPGRGTIVTGVLPGARRASTVRSSTEATA